MGWDALYLSVSRQYYPYSYGTYLQRALEEEDALLAPVALLPYFSMVMDFQGDLIESATYCLSITRCLGSYPDDLLEAQESP